MKVVVSPLKVRVFTSVISEIIRGIKRKVRTKIIHLWNIIIKVHIFFKNELFNLWILKKRIHWMSQVVLHILGGSERLVDTSQTVPQVSPSIHAQVAFIHLSHQIFIVN